MTRLDPKKDKGEQEEYIFVETPFFGLVCIRPKSIEELHEKIAEVRQASLDY